MGSFRLGISFALSALVLFARGAVADGPVPPVAPPPAPPSASLAAQLKKVNPDGTIELKDGRMALIYTVNHVKPMFLKQELEKWKSPVGVVDQFEYETKHIELPVLGAGYFFGAPPPPFSEKTTIFANRLILVDTPEYLQVMQKMLEMLDRPIPQVYVEARVVEITHDSNFELGFDVSFDKAPTGDDTFFRSGTGVFNPDSFLQSLLPGTRPFQGSTLKFGLTGDDAKKYGSLDYAIRALQERGNAEILSEPSIIATQGELASIITGQQTPVQSGEIQGTLSIVRTTFVDTGIRLDITPLLIGKDFVKLDVRPSVTQVTSFIVIAAGGITSPIISKREANSIVSMRDGQMLVIGGLYSTNKIREYRQVPFLGDIPGLGYFFRSNRERDVKSELIFFIRPHIIHEWQEAAVLIPPGERERKGNAETKAPAPESKKTEKVEKKGP